MSKKNGLVSSRSHRLVEETIRDKTQSDDEGKEKCIHYPRKILSTVSECLAENERTKRGHLVCVIMTGRITIVFVRLGRQWNDGKAMIFWLPTLALAGEDGAHSSELSQPISAPNGRLGMKHEGGKMGRHLR